MYMYMGHYTVSALPYVYVLHFPVLDPLELMVCLICTDMSMWEGNFSCNN